MRIHLLLAASMLLCITTQAAGESSAQPDSATVVTFPDIGGIALVVPDTASAVPERDVFDLLNQYVLKRRIEPELSTTTRTGLSWALLPTFSYNPVYGVALGVMATGAGQRGSSDARYSSLSISGNASTTGQIQAQVRGDMFSTSGDFLARMDFRYLDTERSTWGLGPFDGTQTEFPMSFKLMRGYATVYRVASGPVFIGLGYHYDEFNDIVDERADQGELTPFGLYSGDGVSRTVASGLSLNLLGDTRDNLVNPSAGYYLSMSMRNYTKSLGSDKNWQEVWAEMRVYPHVPKTGNNVLAFWLYTWFTFGPAPYLNLPSDGWDTYGRASRGYLQGRIRGGNQIYLESEYRVGLSRDGLWGAVVFANFISTTDPETLTFGKANLGAGVGLRVKFNKRSDTNLTIDHGWGQEGSRGLYLGLSEVF
ncbi:MAG TPA: hypothetical protein VFX92_09805 [Candidatus Krumholzibacteria bacterium]|nr:hypothetical protein [Candidatus Krumholzibacteria bacterium]